MCISDVLSGSEQKHEVKSLFNWPEQTLVTNLSQIYVEKLLSVSNKFGQTCKYNSFVCFDYFLLI